MTTSHKVGSGTEDNGDTATATVADGTTIDVEFINDYARELTSVTVKKIWNDNNNKANKRAPFVSVQLYAGTAVSGVAARLDENNSWTHTWTNLPKYDDAGQLISYSVKELNVPAEYTDSVTTDPVTGEITITNTRVGTKGKLVLTKMVVGSVDKTTAASAIEFKITDEAGNVETYSLNDFKYDVTTKQYTLELEKPAGKYTVEETKYDIDGYETKSIKYAIGTGLQKDGKTVDVQVEIDETVDVTFVDTYDETTTKRQPPKILLRRQLQKRLRKLHLRKRLR